MNILKRIISFQNIRSLGAPHIHATDLSASGTAGQTEITKITSVPSGKTIDQWTEASTTEIPESEERTSVSQKLVWGLVSGVLAALVMAVAVVVLLCWNSKRRTRKKNKDSNGSAHQSTPLMQQRKYINNKKT